MGRASSTLHALDYESHKIRGITRPSYYWHLKKTSGLRNVSFDTGNVTFENLNVILSSYIEHL